VAAARHYRGAAGADYFAYQARIGRVGARLNRWKFLPHVGPADTVVDFGCGGGWLLAGLPAARRIGVEVNPVARAVAEAQGLEVVAGTDALEDGLADVVISNHALEHTLAPAAELAGLRRVLRPGGRLVLWLPLDDWRTQRRVRPEPNHHLYTWTPLLLANLLGEAGFAVERCAVVAHAWPPGFARLARLPAPLFDVLARAWAVARRRRQLVAIARRPAG